MEEGEVWALTSIEQPCQAASGDYEISPSPLVAAGVYYLPKKGQASDAEITIDEKRGPAHMTLPTFGKFYSGITLLGSKSGHLSVMTTPCGLKRIPRPVFG